MADLCVAIPSYQVTFSDPGPGGWFWISKLNGRNPFLSGHFLRLPWAKANRAERALLCRNPFLSGHFLRHAKFASGTWRSKKSQSLLIRSLSPTGCDCFNLSRAQWLSQSLLIRSLSPTKANRVEREMLIALVAIPSYQVTFSDSRR